MLRFKQYLPLHEAGFSTKRSNLQKYIPLINKDFNLGFELECYAGEHAVSGGEPPEPEGEYIDSEFEEYVDCGSFTDFIQNIPSLGQKLTPSVSDALIQMWADDTEKFGREAILQAIITFS